MAIGERIKQSRSLAGLTQAGLASLVQVTPQAISKYELAEDVPSSGVLLRLASALEMPLEFFLRPIRVGNIEPEYRAKASLKPRQQEVILAKIRDWLERYLEIEELLYVKGVERVNELPTGFPYPVHSYAEVEEAALVLRQEWNLGTAPIRDMTELLESQGIKVGLVKSENNSDFDACTFRAEVDGGAHVIAVREGLPGDRQRFSLAHELGHIVLQPHPSLDREKVAHRFAGAFLAPAGGIRQELGERRHRISTLELHLLKHRFGLSMAAIVYRCCDLDILSGSTAKTVWATFRKHKWNLKEPGDEYPPEKPSRMDRLVLRAVSEGIISHGRAAELLNQPLQEFLQKASEEHGGLPASMYC